MAPSKSPPTMTCRKTIRPPSPLQSLPWRVTPHLLPSPLWRGVGVGVAKLCVHIRRVLLADPPPYPPPQGGGNKQFLRVNAPRRPSAIVTRWLRPSPARPARNERRATGSDKSPPGCSARSRRI